MTETPDREELVTIKVRADANDLLEKAIAEYNDSSSMRLNKGAAVAVLIKSFCRMSVEDRRRLVFEADAPTASDKA
jgi:hypothetical protein